MNSVNDFLTHCLSFEIHLTFTFKFHRIREDTLIEIIVLFTLNSFVWKNESDHGFSTNGGIKSNYVALFGTLTAIK